jgi:serine/threonine protein kinase
MPASVRSEVERLVGGLVVKAENRPGGFSPGFASRLRLADGRRVFVKAMDVDTWPGEAPTYQAEARIAAALPLIIAAPRFLGTFDDSRWIVLAFEDIDGEEPVQPWNHTDLDRVLAALDQLSTAGTPSPVALPHSHPRLGGWAEVASDGSCLERLPEYSPWAADNISLLIQLEEEGLQAAQGPSLVHFDLYPHNILLTPKRVVLVDWPHARLGAPIVDLVIVLSSAAAVGIDPEPILHHHAASAEHDPRSIDAVVAAQAGFCLAGGLYRTPPEMQPIVDQKLKIGLGTTEWLRRRLTSRN